MEWIERLNRSVSYIEEHLTEEIDPAALAQIACCSVYHYQRMFAYMSDTPLSEYIRRRRMTLAAADLLDGEKVVDVAVKYGYNSPTAFNRAFQGVHGVAPSRVRENGVALKSFQPISFVITIKGAEEMNYTIQKRDAIRIVGISKPIFADMEKNFEIIPPMWQQAGMDGTLGQLAGMMNSEPMGILGVTVYNDREEMRYFIAAASTAPVDGTPFEEYTIPPATWAVFAGEGTNTSIQQLEKRIITEWFPSSGYEYGNAADIEVYLNADPANAKYEVWVPVVGRNC